MQFNLYSQYYDLIYKSKDYSAEAKKVYDKIAILKPHILELGCGSGGHASILSEFGCSVMGLDISKSMIEIANSKNISNFNAIEANIEDFQLNVKFDAAISIFHVMSYLVTDRAIINCLKSVSHHLNVGGLFIFDFWFLPAVYHQGFENRLKTFENDKITVVRESYAQLDNNTNTANINFNIIVTDKISNKKERILEQHLMRFYTIQDINTFAAQAGFKVIEYFDLHSEKKPSIETWAITVKLIKI